MGSGAEGLPADQQPFLAAAPSPGMGPGKAAMHGGLPGPAKRPPGEASFAAALGAVAFWYTANICLLMTNRQLLAQDFRLPGFLTLLHMTTTCAVMNVFVYGLGLCPPENIRSRAQLGKILTLSFTFGPSIVLGVSSLKYIPLNLEEAIASTTPLATALLLWLVTGKVESRAKYGAMGLCVLGIMIASQGEPSWHTLGVFLACAATASRGLKSVMQQVLMTGSGETMKPMNLVRWMALFSALLLLPAIHFIDGWGNVTSKLSGAAEGGSGFYKILALNLLLAVAQNFASFLVTKCVGALSMQVLGNAKNILGAVISVIVFSTPITAVSAAGYSVTAAGIICYCFVIFAEGKAKERALVK